MFGVWGSFQTWLRIFLNILNGLTVEDVPHWIGWMNVLNICGTWVAYHPVVIYAKVDIVSKFITCNASHCLGSARRTSLFGSFLFNRWINVFLFSVSVIMKGTNLKSADCAGDGCTQAKSCTCRTDYRTFIIGIVNFFGVGIKILFWRYVWTIRHLAWKWFSEFFTYIFPRSTSNLKVLYDNAFLW